MFSASHKKSLTFFYVSPESGTAVVLHQGWWEPATQNCPSNFKCTHVTALSKNCEASQHTRHTPANWFKHLSLPSVSSPALSYVNWFYLYRKHLPQSWSFGKEMNNRKTAIPNGSLSPKIHIFSTVWCKLGKFFSVLCTCVCQVRGPNAIQSTCKEPDTTLSGSRGLAVVTEPNSSCVPGVQALSKNICCENYFLLPAVLSLTGNLASRTELQAATSKCFKILVHLHFLC